MSEKRSTPKRGVVGENWLYLRNNIRVWWGRTDPITCKKMVDSSTISVKINNTSRLQK